MTPAYLLTGYVRQKHVGIEVPTRAKNLLKENYNCNTSSQLNNALCRKFHKTTLN